ncbi:MAG: hypothetical protein ACE5IY_15820 [bacterium]
MFNKTSGLFISSFSMLLMFVAMPVAKAQPGKSSTLPQIANLFIGTWVGHGTTPDGEPFVSELSFKWTLNKSFLEVNNQVKRNGKSQRFAFTLYGWQPVLGQLVFWSFDEDGTINEGLAELAGNTLKHQWRSFSQNGEIREWRSTLTLEEKNKVTFTMLDNRDNVLNAIVYRREK